MKALLYKKCELSSLRVSIFFLLYIQQNIYKYAVLFILDYNFQLINIKRMFKKKNRNYPYILCLHYIVGNLVIR